MKYKVEVDRETCIACGNCYSTDPYHFDHSDDGKSKVVGGTVDGKSTGSFDDDKITDAQVAADACPVQAITVTRI
jgi:ferredoxin